jgi:hypothetical protein
MSWIAELNLEIQLDDEKFSIWMCWTSQETFWAFPVAQRVVFCKPSHSVCVCVCVCFVGNSATLYFLQATLVASMVGLASVFAGIHHVRVWGTDSLSAAHATALIAWLLTLLALG